MSPETFTQVDGGLFPASAAPTDRTFRDAWVVEGGAIVVDPEKAKAINDARLDAEAKAAATIALAELAAETIVQDDSKPDDAKRKVAAIFPRWTPDEAVTLGAIRRHGSGLYRCIQAHTTQADWTPPDTPALWDETLPDGQIGPWKQPAGGHDAYQIGDKVTHNGATWTSTAANNVWEPGVHGWTQD